MAVDYAALKKGGFMRQKQKNNFSLRLQVVGGNLTAENLIKIAEVSEKYGDGHVHLTSRQSVEIPFIKLENVDEVKEELGKGGCKPGVSARSQLVRDLRSVQVETLIPMILRRNSMSVITQENFHISSNLALPDARTTA